MPQEVIINHDSTQICGKRRKALHPVDKKKPASPEGDGFPSTVLRRFPLTQLLTHEVDTHQKQRQRTHRKQLGASRSVKKHEHNKREEAKQRQPRNPGPSRSAQ